MERNRITLKVCSLLLVILFAVSAAARREPNNDIPHHRIQVVAAAPHAGTVRRRTVDAPRRRPGTCTITAVPVRA